MRNAGAACVTRGKTERKSLKFEWFTDASLVFFQISRKVGIYGVKGWYVKIITENAINFQASRTDLNNIWLQKVESILEKFHRDKIHVIPNLAGSLPNNCFTDILEIPTIWIPHSYKECSQHAPNEHLPINLLKDSLLLMTNLYWNLGVSDHNH